MSENFIYDENAELSIGENPIWVEKLLAAFPAFASKNYRLYFGSQLISLIGTWLQIVAEGWLVLQLTNSPFLIGLVGACATVPSLLFSLFGGVIVDRLPKRYILMVTQFAAMILALLYGVLTVTHVINIYGIAILAFLLGVVNAIDIPARQAFVVELVDKEGLSSAIALNSGVFNAARVVGPSVAGLLIALIGSGGAFILNGLSYIFAIVALFYMTTPTLVAKHTSHPLKAIKEGIEYTFAHPVIKNLIFFTAIISIFGWSYSTLMPYIATHTFHVGASGLGYLYAANGLGSLVATFFISAYSKKLSPLVFIFGGCWVFTLAVISFSFTSSLLLALPLLFIAGFGLISQFAVMNTLMQQMVDDTMRGRVMSIYSLAFLGLFPLGNLQVGFVAEHFGTAFAIQFGAIVGGLFGLYLFLRRQKIREAQQAYSALQTTQ